MVASMRKLNSEEMWGKTKCRRVESKDSKRWEGTGNIGRFASAAEEIGGRGHLLLYDSVVLMLLGSSLLTLPGESAAEEVHENISERL